MVNQPLILDLLEWVGTKPPPYNDVMGAGRTTCPGLTIWEHSVDAKFVTVHKGCVRVTPQGFEFLKAHRKDSTIGKEHAAVN